jgi:hypothetical protein
MNQYRCETCKKRTTISCPIQDESDYYKVKEYVTAPTGWEILTSVIGCASHSDFQSEREKVLDEAIEYWEQVIEHGRGVSYNHPITYEWMYRGVVDYLKQLRQAGEP